MANGQTTTSFALSLLAIVALEVAHALAIYSTPMLIFYFSSLHNRVMKQNVSDAGLSDPDVSVNFCLQTRLRKDPGCKILPWG